MIVDIKELKGESTSALSFQRRRFLRQRQTQKATPAGEGGPAQGSTGQRTSAKLWDLLNSGLGTLEITLLLNNTSVMFPFRVSMENVYKEENHFTSRKKSQLIHPCSSNIAIMPGLHCQMTGAWKGLYKQMLYINSMIDFTKVSINRQSTYIQ